MNPEPTRCQTRTSELEEWRTSSSSGLRYRVLRGDPKRLAAMARPDPEPESSAR